MTFLPEWTAINLAAANLAKAGQDRRTPRPVPRRPGARDRLVAAAGPGTVAAGPVRVDRAAVAGRSGKEAGAMTRPTFLSLFAGIGGLDLGLERSGWHCVGQVEIDRACGGVLARHFPDVPRWRDITEVAPDELPRADLVCGGFPCQDISVAGRRAGLAGSRSGLWWQFHRIVAGIRPNWILVENVPGLLSSNGGRDMGAILGALGDLGYGYAFRVLDAQHFGLAQRRRRVFIVGCAGNWRAPAQVLLESEGGEGDPAPRRAAGQRVAASLTAGTAAARGVNAPGRRAEDDVNLIAYALRADPGGTGQGHNTNYVVAQCHGPNVGPMGTLKGDGSLNGGVPFIAGPLGGGNDGTGRRTENDPNLVVGALMAGSPTSYRVGPDEVAANQVVAYNVHAAESCAIERHAYESDTARSLDTTGGFAANQGGTVVGVRFNQRAEGRLRSAHGSLNAQPSGKQYDGVIDGTAVRRLTPTECERLQGFPDGWTADQSDSTRYRQLGNAVAVPCATWIGRRIAARQAERVAS